MVQGASLANDSNVGNVTQARQLKVMFAGFNLVSVRQFRPPTFATAVVAYGLSGPVVFVIVFCLFRYFV